MNLKESTVRRLATIGLILVPVLCCGLPVLIAAGALAGVGSVLGNPWLIGAAVALLAGVVAWRIRRHTGTATPPDGCCAPEPPGQAQVRPPNHREER